jgi:hypothetical protein
MADVRERAAERVRVDELYDDDQQVSCKVVVVRVVDPGSPENETFSALRLR